MDTWESFERSLGDFLNDQNQRPGRFARDDGELYWRASSTLQVPPIENAPYVMLPLRFQISRGNSLGTDCLSEADCRDKLLQ
jgi:hypothetical protein